MTLSDTFTGVIIGLVGGLFAQIAIYLQDWIRSQRETKRKEHERGLELKRDLYLPLINAFTEALTLITSIPQKEPADLSSIKLSQEAQNALGSAGLIASNNVIVAVNAASRQLTQSLMRLMAHKIDEAKLAMELDGLAKQINELNTANRIIIDRMKALQDSGALNPQEAKALDVEFEEHQAQLKDLFTQQTAKFASRSTILRDLQIETMREVIQLAVATAEAVIAIRHDLEIPTDEQALRRHFRDSLNYLDEAFPGFVDEVWNKVENKAEQ